MSLTNLPVSNYLTINDTLNCWEILKYLESTDIRSLSQTCKDIRGVLNSKFILSLFPSLPSFASLRGRVGTITNGATFAALVKKPKSIPQLLSLNQWAFLEQCDLCDTVKSYKHTIPDDIKDLLGSKDLLTPDDLKKLKDYINARDTLIVWKKIACAANVSLDFKIDDFDLWSSSAKMISKAQEYQQWCESHKNELGVITELNFAYNSLTLPPDLTPFPKLKNLFLFANNLPLPPDVAPCSELEQLYLDHNNLTLAPNITKCPKLKVLRLAHNKLPLPPDVTKCLWLEELDILSNKLILAPNVTQCPQLKRLILSYNELILAPNVTQCPQLKTLSLFFNNLTLPSDVTKCPHLEELSFFSNNLILAPDVTQCPQLKALSLACNKIPLAPDVTKCLQLRSLDLSGNPCEKPCP